jgi:hypothetical protein
VAAGGLAADHPPGDFLVTYHGYVVIWRPGRRRGTYVGAVYHDLAHFPSDPLHLTTGRSNYRYALRAAEAWVDRQLKKGTVPK